MRWSVGGISQEAQTGLTFPQPGNSQACTRLPFLALLMRPVGVEVGASSKASWLLRSLLRFLVGPMVPMEEPECC